MIFGTFGPLIFARQFGLMHSFESTQSEVFVEHPIHLLKPQVEHVGSGLAHASLDLEFHDELTTPPQAGITLLESIKEAAIAYPLIIGGRPIAGFRALFVLVEFGQAHHWYLSSGQIQHATVKASFLEYAIKPAI
jgi:hypothetical protein